MLVATELLVLNFCNYFDPLSVGYDIMSFL